MKLAVCSDCLHSVQCVSCDPSVADGTAELTCSPSCEASLFKDYMRVSAAAFARLGSISCPITIASGSNSAFFGAVEPEAPRIAAHLQQGHLDK